MRAPDHGPMTSQQLVDAVAAADLGEYMPGRDDEFGKACNADYHARLRVFLAGLGADPLDWIRARRDVKMARWAAEDGR
jgi:hypothetical protein